MCWVCKCSFSRLNRFCPTCIVNTDTRNYEKHLESLNIHLRQTICQPGVFFSRSSSLQFQPFLHQATAFAILPSVSTSSLPLIHHLFPIHPSPSNLFPFWLPYHIPSILLHIYRQPPPPPLLSSLTSPPSSARIKPRIRCYRSSNHVLNTKMNRSNVSLIRGIEPRTMDENETYSDFRRLNKH